MTSTTNRDRLIALMERLALSKEEVAEVAKSSVSTVESWLKPETSKSARVVPEVVLEVLNYSAGDKVCSSADEAADELGTTLSAVKRAVEESKALLGVALWERKQDILKQVQEGRFVNLTVGSFTFLLAPGWVFLPVENLNRKRVKLGVRAEIRSDSEGVLFLETQIDQWADARKAARSAAAATRLADLNEQMNVLGARLVRAKDEEDQEAINRIEHTMELVGRQIEAVDLH